MDQLMDPDRRTARSPIASMTRGTTCSCTRPSARTSPPARPARERSDVRTDVPIPAAPFFGARVLRDIPLDEVFSLLDLDELYRLQWGGRGSGPAFDRTVRRSSSPTLRATHRGSGARRLARAAGGVRRRSRCSRTGNDLVVYDPAAYASDGGALRETGALQLSRGRSGASVCAWPTISGPWTPATWMSSLCRSSQSATPHRSDSRRCSAQANTRKRIYVHGLAVETAEAVADGCTVASGVSGDSGASQGKRYSWGYGACPDLDDHATVFRLLPVADALGMTLTAAVSAHTRAVDGGDHRAPPRREVLRRPWRLRRRGRDEACVARGGGMTTGVVPTTSASRVGAAPAPPVVRPRSDLLARLVDPERIVVFDGAMGTMLYAKGRVHQSVLR